MNAETPSKLAPPYRSDEERRRTPQELREKNATLIVKQARTLEAMQKVMLAWENTEPLLEVLEDCQGQKEAVGMVLDALRTKRMVLNEMIRSLG